MVHLPRISLSAASLPHVRQRVVERQSCGWRSPGFIPRGCRKQKLFLFLKQKESDCQQSAVSIPSLVSADDLFLCQLLPSYGATQLPKVERRLHHKALEKSMGWCVYNVGTDWFRETTMVCGGVRLEISIVYCREELMNFVGHWEVFLLPSSPPRVVLQSRPQVSGASLNRMFVGKVVFHHLVDGRKSNELSNLRAYGYRPSGKWAAAD